MSIENDPNVNKAKMLALLALLDVLDGHSEMTTVGADKVGGNDRYGRAGKLRLRFTVFGDETRLLRLAHDLTLAGSHEAMMRMVDRMITRRDKIKLAASMIQTWTEVIQRLLADPNIEQRALPPDREDPRLAVDVNLDVHGQRTIRRLPGGDS